MYVAYEGPQDGPGLVLLHGGIGAGRYHWSKQVHGLVEDGWRVHLPDLPGHGHTPVGETYSRDVLVAALRAHLAVQTAPPVVAGFSMGGHTALALAQDEPELFGGLVTVGISTADHPGLQAWRTNFDPDVLAEAYPLWARALSKLHEPQGGPDAWRDVCRRDAGGLEVDVDTDRLSRLDVPTLLIRGDRDATVDPAHYARLREIWPHAEEFVVPGGLHDVQLTRSVVVAPVLRDFLARNRP